MKVLLDTNALLMPGQFGIDLFGELQRLLGAIEPCIIPATQGELEKIALGRGKDAAAARFGLSIVGRCTMIPAETSKRSVDEQLASRAEEMGCVVVTNDRALRDLLLAKGIGVISMRKKKILAMIRR